LNAGESGNWKKGMFIPKLLFSKRGLEFPTQILDERPPSPEVLILKFFPSMQHFQQKSATSVDFQGTYRGSFPPHYLLDKKMGKTYKILKYTTM